MSPSPKIRFLRLSIIVPAMFMGLLGCQKTKEKEAVLAQVGSATLTLSELRESFPAEYEEIIPREQYLDFIKRWIDDEVVYQQAQKANLAKDTLVARKLAKIMRKLMIEEFLARDNAHENTEPDEMAMSQYYEMHKEDFRRKVPEVKFVHIRVETAKQAADLRNKIMRGDFLAIAASSSLDPIPESYTDIGFKKQNEFTPCLSQGIINTGLNTVSQPIASCSDGIYLIKVLDRQEAGSLIPFAECKEEISSILAMTRKDKLLDGRIAKYKDGLSISYNLDQIPGQSDKPMRDSTKTKTENLPVPPSEVKAEVKAETQAEAQTPVPVKSISEPMPVTEPKSRLPDTLKPQSQSRPQSRTQPQSRTRPREATKPSVKPPTAAKVSPPIHANVNGDSEPLGSSNSPNLTPVPKGENSIPAQPESEENNNVQTPPPTP